MHFSLSFYFFPSLRNASWAGLALIFSCFSRFMEPLHSGTYPAVMVSHVGARLPKFSRSESLMVKGSFDFIGLNYYTANYAADAPCLRGNPTLFSDSCVRSTSKLQNN